MQTFVKKLLRDVQSLEYMLDHDWFETDTIRIGAEQEMCLVDTKTYKPATIAMQALDLLKEHDWVETELASFNLETNLTPRVFTGSCLSDLEAENRKKLHIINDQLKTLGATLVLTGILPTLRKYDLEMSNLTPKKRYYALMEAINSQLVGNGYELRLAGIDELLVRHDSPLLEACNTSFQVHLQVTPHEFVDMYNISQALAGPIMAISANSPIVFGKRLWHESRIALFQQSIDVRTTQNHMRERSPRVNFGSGWLEDSIMEIYREDIARFRVLLSADIDEDSADLVSKGKVPKLRALQVHNSTVYRWNRPCYGISDNGKPHLRIENRVLPAGPTVLDEVANAALWLGAMTGMKAAVKDIREEISWADVRDNFVKSAKFGIDAKLNWSGEKKMDACELILKEILPIAREGLKIRKVKKEDIDKYLGVIEERAKSFTNGARWQLRAFTKLTKEVNRFEAVSVLTSSIVKNQSENHPIHEWIMPKADDLAGYRPTKLLVDEFMSTDLLTVEKDDLIELVAELMNWRKVRYMPVEDSKGQLSGLITSRIMLRHFAGLNKFNKKNSTHAGDIMIKNPITVGPKATIVETLKLMRQHKVGCLPVIQDGELIGVITEMDFLRVSGRLIERLESEGQ